MISISSEFLPPAPTRRRGRERPPAGALGPFGWLVRRDGRCRCCGSRAGGAGASFPSLIWCRAFQPRNVACEIRGEPKTVMLDPFESPLPWLESALSAAIYTCTPG